MNLIKYLGIQCLLIGMIILTNFYLDSYISKPFTYTDLLAIIIGISILILTLHLSDKLKKRLKSISLFYKISLSILAIFIAIIYIGLITGEIQF
ncbi:hypothetical protein A8L44_17285 [Bacillus sp. FJAT-27986]|nr:hypothetical protein A8L44_17285 [Bacillus sp. FJAT-27986]